MVACEAPARLLLVGLGAVSVVRAQGSILAFVVAFFVPYFAFTAVEGSYVSALGRESAAALGVTLYPAVPMNVQRVANVERAQMLLECPSRAALQRFLADWHNTLHTVRQGPEGKALIRWAVDVDPQVL